MKFQPEIEKKGRVSGLVVATKETKRNKKDFKAITHPIWSEALKSEEILGKAVATMV
jgi:DNA-binding cell septation regulator SpoVG